MKSISSGEVELVVSRRSVSTGQKSIAAAVWRPALWAEIRHLSPVGHRLISCRRWNASPRGSIPDLFLVESTRTS
ncbi:hypothetical protein RB8546 [Rhodopirellula baltica SH 1]|uniref:Uncharacterized protein n=1 Tax=Rhodopirellula baltica (strain DSM 10527 / NCIMB 13988 / SH1) TaxID=243090 RepID=Q7UFH8_RHOBA|nr:hypothetical protein RB8546 [Rhodopirellula baltica SH 1]